jgi:rubrerythrin
MSILKETCEKCGHSRTLRTEKPKKCPNCGHVKGSKIYKKSQVEEQKGATQ